MPGPGGSPAILLERVSFLRQRHSLLADVSWRVERGEQWALLGPNGAGKSTLLSLAGAIEHPTRGRVEVLGERLGRTDVRRLRERIGSVDAKVDRKLLPDYDTETVVLTGATGTRVPLWERYDESIRARAVELLSLLGCADLATRPFGICSQGERQRVLIARALMSEPELLLLDEPAVALDLPAREALVAAIAATTGRNGALTTVVATHHLEELPSTTTHALLLRGGRVVAAGPADEVLADETLSRCFELAIEVGRRNGRWWAHAPAGWRRA
ncbi:MAG: ABC transporter ATP-binding protein [Gaiellaceae bacterium]